MLGQHWRVLDGMAPTMCASRTGFPRLGPAGVADSVGILGDTAIPGLHVVAWPCPGNGYIGRGGTRRRRIEGADMCVSSDLVHVKRTVIINPYIGRETPG